MVRVSSVLWHCWFAHRKGILPVKDTATAVFLAQYDHTVMTFCLQVRNTVIVIGGQGKTTHNHCIVPVTCPCSLQTLCHVKGTSFIIIIIIVASWCRHTSPSQEHCHPSVLWCHLFGRQEGHPTSKKYCHSNSQKLIFGEWPNLE